jgi:putative membrane protein
MPRPKLMLESIQPDQFIATAHVECLTEVQLGHIAATQAGDAHIRELALRAIEDYEKAGLDIVRIAARRKLPVPESLDEEHLRVIEEMREKSGRDFDAAYATRIKNNQPKAIMLFQRGQRIKDPEISALASRALSMIESWARKTSLLFEEKAVGQEGNA